MEQVHEIAKNASGNACTPSEYACIFPPLYEIKLEIEGFCQNIGLILFYFQY
jgi:hypothetical protein